MDESTREIKVAVLEEKYISMLAVLTRLDETIDKLSDLCVNVSKMLAVHEEKIEVANEKTAEMAQEVLELEARMESDVEVLAARVRALERRVWVGVGILGLAGLLLQSEIVTLVAPSPVPPAIMEKSDGR